MGEIGAARAKFLRASSPRLAKKKGTQFLPGCLFVLCEGASSPSPKVLLQSIEISAILEVHGIPCGSLPRNGTSRLLRNLQGEQLAIGAIAFSPRRKTAVLWRLALPRKSGLPVYIAPYGEPCRREGNFMSDFELLSIVLMILAIIVTLMVELFKSMKK